MAFARKREIIMKLRPDVLLLQECSEKDVVDTDAIFNHWVGSNPNKGLGVIGFAKHDYRVSGLYDDSLPWFIPLDIIDINLHIIATWAHVKTKQLRYVRVTNKAIEHYREFINESPILIAGDFNSNTIWDKYHPDNSHSDMVKKLKEMNIDSLYHYRENQLQGSETKKTLYMYRNKSKGYHIDFAFVTKDLLDRSIMEIGNADKWLDYSDHVPIIIDIDFDNIS